MHWIDYNIPCVKGLDLHLLPLYLLFVIRIAHHQVLIAQNNSFPRFGSHQRRVSVDPINYFLSVLRFFTRRPVPSNNDTLRRFRIENKSPY